jgi:hypothetical protein
MIVIVHIKTNMPICSFDDQESYILNKSVQNNYVDDCSIPIVIIG